MIAEARHDEHQVPLVGPAHRAPLALLSLSLVAAAIAALAGTGLALKSGFRPAEGAAPASRAQPLSRPRVSEAYGKLPLRFEANRGQTDSRVKFLSRGAGYTLFLTPREAVLSLRRPGRRSESAQPGVVARSRPESDGARYAAVRMRFVGANTGARMAGAGRLAGTSNYLTGRDPGAWRTKLPSYASALYRGIYPGVDLVYHGKQGRLEYDFRVAPGADPHPVALEFSGVHKLSLDRRGDLVLRTAAGVLRQHKPVIYQQKAGARRAIPGRFVLRGDRVGFRIGRYDHTKALVIDPVLAYSTYLGGGGAERGSAIDVDASGDAYVAGFTTSADFPVTDASYQTTRTGDPADVFDTDAFVAKLSPAGKLVYATFLGGSGGDDFANGIAVGPSGRAYVAGETQSFGFPTTGGAFQSTAPNNFGSAFVSVLNANGSGLVYSSYLGGNVSDRAADVAVDDLGRAYVTGFTSSDAFPTTPGAWDRTCDSPPGTSCSDAFVAKLDPDATGNGSLVYSTYLGGDGDDNATGIALDPAKNAYVTGATNSADFPTRKPPPGQGAARGGGDAFVTKLNAAGSRLSYSTHVGGTADDYGGAIAVDSTGHAYITGSTTSADFPVRNAFQPGTGSPDGYDAFVTELSPTGSEFAYSTYLGGTGYDQGHGISVDPSGGAYVVGQSDRFETSSPGGFPTVDPLARAAVQGDAFVARVRPGGSGLSLSSPLGGGGEDVAYAVGVDPSGNAYMTGDAVSTDFPTRHPLQAQSAGRGIGDRRDMFVARVTPDDPASPLITRLGRFSGAAGTPLTLTGHGFTGASAVRFGAVAASTFTVNSDGQITATAPPGPSGSVAVTVTTSAGTSPPNPVATFAYAEGVWDLTGSLVLGRRQGEAATVLRDGRVLVAGGRDDAFDLVTAAEIYFPSTGTWLATNPMLTGREDFTATVLDDGRVLVAGGGGADGVLDTAELYDPAGGAWTTTGSMTQARRGHTATLLGNGKVLVAGGEGPQASAELYDPATGKWSSAGSLGDARSKHTATLLPDGRVLVVGGCCDGEGNSLDSAELYVPATNRWMATGSLGSGRAEHTATRLRDGHVLVAGGNPRLSSLASAEVYDPASGTFTDTVAMARRRAGAAAALTSDGRVLVAGGTETNSYHNTAELYDPDTGRWLSAGVMNRYRGFGYDGQMVFALPLGTGKVLVVGDSESPGATTELYDPPGPTRPTGSSATGPGTLGSEQASGGSNPASGGAMADTSAPVVTAFSVTNTPFVVGRRPTPRLGVAAALRHRRGTTFTYGLSEAATVRIVISRRRSGRRKANRCVAPTRELRHAKRCVRVIGKGSLTRTSRRGANRVAFSGRVGRRALQPGRYQARLTATDLAKNTSRPKMVTFTIVKR